MRSPLFALAVAVAGTFASRAVNAEGTVSYEVREEVTGVVLPSHNYDVGGSCTTGTGTAPANIYTQGGTGRGGGFGAGVGARLGYQHAASPPGERGMRWWGFRVGSGLDINLLYASVATGLTDPSGKLCARVKSEGTEVQYEGSSMVLAQIPVFLGAELGLGKAGDGGSWDGIVLGAAWAPTINYLKPWNIDGAFHASLLGAELTLDFVTLQQRTSQQAGKRVAVFFLLPAQDHGPVITTLSFGAVWY